MTGDSSALVEKVRRDPEFALLVSRRSRLAWGLSTLMVAIYFGFILLIAFEPGWLGTPIGSRVTTWGIPIGIGVILSAFVLTGIYVRRANTEFDAMTHAILERTR